MRQQAIQMEISVEATLVEKESLCARENAEYTLKLLQAHGMKTVILITTPLHQLRTYLTFTKVFQPEWNPYP